MYDWLQIGAKLPEGTVAGMTNTSYKVLPPGRCSVCGTPGGDCHALDHGLHEANYVFVPFTRVHPPVPADMLVEWV